MKNYTISLATGMAVGIITYAIGESPRFEIAYGIGASVFVFLWLVPYMIRDALRKENE